MKARSDKHSKNKNNKHDILYNNYRYVLGYRVAFLTDVDQIRTIQISSFDECDLSKSVTSFTPSHILYYCNTFAEQKPHVVDIQYAIDPIHKETEGALFVLYDNVVKILIETIIGWSVVTTFTSPTNELFLGMVVSPHGDRVVTYTSTRLDCWSVMSQCHLWILPLQKNNDYSLWVRYCPNVINNNTNGINGINDKNSKININHQSKFKIIMIEKTRISMWDCSGVKPINIWQSKFPSYCINPRFLSPSYIYMDRYSRDLCYIINTSNGYIQKSQNSPYRQNWHGFNDGTLWNIVDYTSLLCIYQYSSNNCTKTMTTTTTPPHIPSDIKTNKSCIITIKYAASNTNKVVLLKFAKTG